MPEKLKAENVVDLGAQGRPEAVIDAVRHILDQERLTQGEICRQSGVSQSSLSQLLKGTYPGKAEQVVQRLQRWLDQRERQAPFKAVLPQAPGWVETPTAKRIHAALSYAQLAGDLAVIYGGAGVGKTETLRAYARENPQVWLVTGSPAITSVPAVLARIAEALGFRRYPHRASRLETIVAERMTGRSGLLVIDEAQHLDLAALEAVRSLHDASGCGLALSGNEYIYSRLTGRERAAHFAQLFSRIGKRVSLGRPLDGDIQALCDAWGLGSEEARVAGRIASRPGALRGMTKALRLASMYAAGEQADQIRTDHIQAAVRELEGVSS